MTKPIDLRPDHAAIVQEVLARHLPAGVSVRVFGSRAKWTAKTFSDLDLALKGKEKLPYKVMVELADAFEESDLPFRVDVVDWRAVTPSFQAVIDRDGVSLQDEGRGGWPMRTLGDLVTLQRGIDLPNQNRKPGNVPIMGSFGITGYHDQARCQGPGVTVGRSGASAGTVCYIEQDYWPLNTCLYVRDFKGNDPRFTFYFLQTFNLAGLNSGSAQPSLNRNYIHPVAARFPDPPEQRAISSVLSALDDKIELNRRMNETLEGMAQAIFRDWFVDFGPVRRKAAGETDAVAIMGGLTPDPARAAQLAALFPDAFGGDGLPETWRLAPFGSLLESSIGGDWGKEEAEGEFNLPVCIIRGTDFPDVTAGGRAKVPTRFTSAKKLRSRELRKGDIVIEVSGGSPTQPTGRSISLTESIIRRFDHPLVCASFCRRFRPIDEFVASLLAVYLRWLYGEGGTWQYQNQSTGISNFQTQHFLAAEKVVLPPAPIIEAFHAFISPLHQISAKNENLILAETRDYLLPRLMSGTVRVARESEAA